MTPQHQQLLSILSARRPHCAVEIAHADRGLPEAPFRTETERLQPYLAALPRRLWSEAYERGTCVGMERTDTFLVFFPDRRLIVGWGLNYRSTSIDGCCGTGFGICLVINPIVSSRIAITRIPDDHFASECMVLRVFPILVHASLACF